MHACYPTHEHYVCVNLHTNSVLLLFICIIVTNILTRQYTIESVDYTHLVSWSVIGGLKVALMHPVNANIFGKSKTVVAGRTQSNSVHKRLCSSKAPKESKPASIKGC